MEFADRLGMVALIMAFIGLGITILWPTQRWIGWVSLGVALVLGGWWGWLEWNKPHHKTEPVQEMAPAASPGTNQPNNSANPSPASDRNAEILKKLEDIQRGLPKDASAPPFLISFGPVLRGNNSSAAEMFVSFTDLSNSVIGNPIELEPANLAFYVGVLNQQSVPSMIQGYKVEVKHGGKWEKLRRLDILGGVHVYSQIVTHKFMPVDDSDFFDSAIYHKSFSPQGPPAFGWVLFRYPEGFALSPDFKIRMTVYDPNGKEAIAEYGEGHKGAEESPQGAGLHVRPAISVPEQQIIRIKPL